MENREEGKLYSIKKDFLGKLVIGKNSGKKIGVVTDVEYNTSRGDLQYLILGDVSMYAQNLNIIYDGNVYKIPATAIDSIGDFIIVDESLLLE